MLNVPQYLRKSTANRCAACGGKFGLIRYYSWRAGLCSKKCRDRFRVREANDFRWLRRIQDAQAFVP